MPKSRKEKKEILDKLENVFTADGTVVFVNYHQVTANEINAMRSSLYEDGIEYYAAKKTLANIALADVDIEGDAPEIAGELALAFPRDGAGVADDTTAPARSIYEFQEAFDERVMIVGGIFKNSFVGQERMQSLAQIPSRDALFSQLAAVLNAPIKRLGIALDEVAKKQA